MEAIGEERDNSQREAMLFSEQLEFLKDELREKERSEMRRRQMQASEGERTLHTYTHTCTHTDASE